MWGDSPSSTDVCCFSSAVRHDLLVRVEGAHEVQVVRTERRQTEPRCHERVKHPAKLPGGPNDQDETDAEWDQRLHERSDRQRGSGYRVGRMSGDFVRWWVRGRDARDETTANVG